jgi:hypothetical protein
MLTLQVRSRLRRANLICNVDKNGGRRATECCVCCTERERSPSSICAARCSYPFGGSDARPSDFPAVLSLALFTFYAGDMLAPMSYERSGDQRVAAVIQWAASHGDSHNPVATRRKLGNEGGLGLELRSHLVYCIAITNNYGESAIIS